MNHSKPCKSCNANLSLSNFHKTTGNLDGYRNVCKACTKIKDAARYAANKEAYRARSRTYYQNNIEIQRKKANEHYAKNREAKSKRKAELRKANLWHVKKLERESYQRNIKQKRAYGRAYSKLHPEQSYIRNARRRARLKNASYYVINEKEILKLRQSECAFCFFKGKIEIDHVIPISRGGLHSIGNLMPLCDNCNATKYNRTIMEWRFYRIKIGKPLPLDMDKL